MSVCEAVYHVANHFGVAGEEVRCVELEIVMILLIRLGVTGSVTLLAYRGAGRKIQGMSAGNFLKWKLLRPRAN
jgi:hypothetical protein